MKDFKRLEEEISRALYNMSFSKTEIDFDKIEENTSVLKLIFKEIDSIMKYIDHKIIISDIDNGFSFLYNFYSAPSRSIEYHNDNGKIICGISIAKDYKDTCTYSKEVTFKLNEELFFDKENNLISPLNDYYYSPNISYSFPERIEFKGSEIFYLRNGKILQFERTGEQDNTLFHEKRYKMINPKTLTKEQLVRDYSMNDILYHILRSFNTAIKLNENRYPIIKKSLNSLFEINNKFEIIEVKEDY